MIALDGTPTKSRLGANALLGVSMAFAKATAAAAGQPLYAHLASLNPRWAPRARTLPVPMMNILNGGAHADSSVDVQEFMVMPAGVGSFAEALRAGAETFHALRSILKGRGLSTGVGDEGGFAPSLRANREALDVVLEAIGKAGLKAGTDVFIALDVAASELWNDGTYVFKKSGEPSRTPARWWRCTRTGCASTRSSRSKTASARATGRAGRSSPRPSATRCRSSAMTSSSPTPKSCGAASTRASANAVLVKLNQIGTVTETLDCIAMAQEADYATVISHRSGETEDATIADLAVATSAGQIKTGSASRTDRVGQVQPAAADRRGTRRQRHVRGQEAIRSCDRRCEARQSTVNARCTMHEHRTFAGMTVRVDCGAQRCKPGDALCIVHCAFHRPSRGQRCIRWYCSATARAPGTRRTGSPGGPTSICPTRAARRPRDARRSC